MADEYTRNPETGFIMQVKSERVRLDLTRTLAILEDRGWCKGSGSHQGSAHVCLEEALACATLDMQIWGRVKVDDGSEGWRWYIVDPGSGSNRRIYLDSAQAKRYSDAYETLMALLPDGCRNLFAWNDEFNRKIEHVKTLIKKGIEANS